MTEVERKNVPTFEYGDVVRIALKVADDSGVQFVEARFRNESRKAVYSIHRSVELDGETEATVILEFAADDGLPPGDYVCEYISLTDKLGNKSLIAAPGIEFHVEGEAKDYEGPALLDWSFA